ncbi:hypothetical protein F5Y16DRAFT_407219 [Xylariaceae sp. FL0255]|nr:hypothetical protein F5Y16DRAFT_407219 [Xylariaceae sp. FL0255]
MDSTDQLAASAGDARDSRPSLQSTTARPIRRRNRMINSCLECRKRKLKCSKTSPTCTNCDKSGRDCLYIGPRLDEASQMRLAEIKEKQGTLERQLERDVAKSSTSKSKLQQRILADEVGDEADDDRDLETTPLVALDLTYEDDADTGTDDMIDLGIKIGKMRLTERVGGLPRPRISEEISAGIVNRPGGAHALQMAAQGTAFDDSMSDGSLPDFLKPSDEYIVPSSGFFFGQIGEPPDILQFMPYRAAADRLMVQYFRAVHPIAPCSHRPSLERMYALFWEEVTAGYEPRPSTQAIIFAAMFSGIISMNEAVAFHELGGYQKSNWVQSLKMGTESALGKANFLRTTSIETMQAFVMYMLCLCRAEISRAHSVLMGAALRMAECMGLNRDGEAYSLTPLETHVRRLVWHQLCFLDIRTCEAQGPKPFIRREDYDTKLPLNVNDDQLTADGPAPEPSDAWTTNTVALIRFEVNEMMRIIWVDRRRLEAHRTTLTAVLTKIENFRRRMSEKYDHLLDVSVPIQRYAKCVMYLLTYRLHVMTLHPYHSGAAHPMPPRLCNLLITSGVMVLELAIQLETNPVFQDWAWYMGAYCQYQIAMLLTTEIYWRPNNREADRIWSCLDYVFGLDRKLPGETKCLQVFGEISARFAVYSAKRKMRGPSSTTNAPIPAETLEGTISKSTGQQQDRQHPSTTQAYQQQLPSTYLPAQQQAPSRQGLVASSHMSPVGGGRGGAGAGGTMPRPEHQSYVTQQQNQHHAPPHRPPMMPTPAPGPSTQSAQLPQRVVYAGVSDSQVLWSLPPNKGSPNDSDSSSIAAQLGTHNPGSAASSATPAPMAMPPVNIMDSIDWDTMYALFPTDTQTGDLSIQGYHDANFGFISNWGPSGGQSGGGGASGGSG